MYIKLAKTPCLKTQLATKPSGHSQKYFSHILQTVKMSFLTATLLILTTKGLIAQDCDSKKIERKTIISIIDRSIYPDIRDTPIHNFLELPFNHLGYKIKYFDTDIIMETVIPEDTIAILSWFDGEKERGDDIARWRMAATTGCGYRPKQIIFGHDGLGFGSEQTRQALLEMVGIEAISAERAVGHRSRVAFADKNLMGYEDDYSVGIGAYPALKASSRNQSHLSVEFVEERGELTDLVTIGPQGAFVHGSATVQFDQRLNAHLWLLDPFKFIELSLGAGPHPIADTTTQLGNRIFFSTVHSDGWLEPEPSRFFGEYVGIASEILLDKLVAPFPDLPIMVAALIGDFVPELAGPMSQRGEQTARALFQQPQVAPATSGHDLVWNWDGVEGSTDIKPPSQSIANEPIVSGAVQALGEIFAANRDGTAFRKYSALEFSFDKETFGALDALQQLSPEEKQSPAFLWSANSRPSEAALRQVREAGAVSLGGGLEPDYPELPLLASLSAQSAKIGSEVLVYGALASDAAYTGYWKRDPAGFHGLRKTLEWTEHPRRLKPFHLSYSARSALFFATRSAIKQHQELARSGDYLAIPATDYIASVMGFETVEFQRTGPLSWQVHNRGGLQTVRFDHADELVLDMSASDGVLGAVRKSETLYVALNPASENPTISLAEDDNPTGIRLARGQIAISKSSTPITSFQSDRCGTRVLAGGMSPSQMVLVTSKSAQIEATFTGQAVALTSDDQGFAVLDLPPAGPFEIIFRTDCTEG